MGRPRERFPRVKLWTQAAELQDLLEYWSSATLARSDDAKDRGLTDIGKRLEERWERLEVAIKQCRELRTELFTCP